jgi:hypothetical protein
MMLIMAEPLCGPAPMLPAIPWFGIGLAGQRVSAPSLGRLRRAHTFLSTLGIEIVFPAPTGTGALIAQTILTVLTQITDYAAEKSSLLLEQVQTVNNDLAADSRPQGERSTRGAALLR